MMIEKKEGDFGKKSLKYRVARAIDGISINGNEFLLDEKGEIMLFNTEQNALDFLNSKGYGFKDSTDAWNKGISIEENECRER